MSISIKTAAVTGEKKVEILDLETPDLRQGEALVKIHAVALCTLEQRIFQGEVKMPLPCTGGHEAAGEIAALGESEKMGGRRPRCSSYAVQLWRMLLLPYRTHQYV